MGVWHVRCVCFLLQQVKRKLCLSSVFLKKLINTKSKRKVRFLSGLRSCVGGRWSQAPAGVTTPCWSPDPGHPDLGPLIWAP